MNKPKDTTAEERFEIDRFEAALKIASDAAATLTQMGMDVHVYGWGQPGNLDGVRLQGNTPFKVVRSARYAKHKD